MCYIEGRSRHDGLGFSFLVMGVCKSLIERNSNNYQHTYMQKAAAMVKTARLSPKCKTNYLIQNGSCKIILMLGIQVGIYCKSLHLNSWH